MTISSLQALLKQFAIDRDWEQFHDPKNLTMALAGEVGELSEIFQWLTPEEAMAVLESPERANQVRDELADVFGYVLRLADVLGVDLEAALEEKVTANQVRYPVELAKGSAAKYTAYQAGES